MRIVVTCADGQHYPIERNKGAEAVLLTTAHLLRQTFPNAEMVTTIQCSERIASLAGWRVLRSWTFKRKVYSPLTTFLGALRLFASLVCTAAPVGKPFLRGAILDRTAQEFASADLIVHVGMDLISDDFGTIAVIEHCQEVLLGILWAKPVVLWAESIGPFRQSHTRALASFTLRRATWLLLRERQSLAIAASLRIPAGKLRLVADPAFLLESRHSAAHSLLRSSAVHQCTRTIGLCLNLGYLAGGIRNDAQFNLTRNVYRASQYLLPESLFRVLVRGATRTGLCRAPLKKQRDYVARMVVLVNELLSISNSRLLLVPHVEPYGLVVNENDLHWQVRAMCAAPDRVVVCEADDGAAATKAYIGLCDVFVGGRMHSNIAALSQAIPTVAVSYSHKFQGIMEDLGLSGYTTDLLDPCKVKNLVVEALNNSEQITHGMAQRLPEIIERARNGTTALRTLQVDFGCPRNSDSGRN